MRGMKAGNYFVLLLLGVVCLGLSVALIFIAQTNQQMQSRLQSQQQTLSGGVLGAQGQQISSSVLQDLGAIAATNSAVRKLLDQHGYRLPGAGAPSKPAVSADEPKAKKSGEEAAEAAEKP
jgi:hypothetical protein